MTPDRETKQDKAQRLINEGRFRLLSDGLWACHGDTGRYLVSVVPDRSAAERANVPVASCTCEAGRASRAVCAHVLGANAIQKHVAGGGTYESKIAG